MLVSVLMSALLISGASAEAEAYAVRAQDLLLAGGQLGPDFRHELAALTPVDRYAVVIWLRRAGLLTGPEIPIAEMLAPIAGPAGTPAPISPAVSGK